MVCLFIPFSFANSPVGEIYDDLRVPLTAVKTGGAADPDFVQFVDDGAGSTGVYAYAFSPTVEEEVFFIAQLPHQWDAGSDIEPHIHWSPSNSNIGNVVWCLEYTWQSIEGIFGDTSTLCLTDDTEAQANKHLIASFGLLDATGQSESSILIGRLYRDATNINDTYGSDAYSLEFDIHYKVDPEDDDMSLYYLTGLIAIIGAIGALLYIAFKIDVEKHFILQFMLLGLSFTGLLIVPGLILEFATAIGVTGGVQLLVLRFITWTFRLVFAYIFIYIIYVVFKKFQELYKMTRT